jgi:signal recognition particle receptor subunit alpha
MLDAFEIISTSGVVLWSRSYASVSPSVVNNFISDVFIEEKSTVAGAKDGASAAANPPYKHDQHSLRWTFSKELGIIFVVSTRRRKEKREPVPQLTHSTGSLPLPASPPLDR